MMDNKLQSVAKHVESAPLDQRTHRKQGWECFIQFSTTTQSTYLIQTPLGSEK